MFRRARVGSEPVVLALFGQTAPAQRPKARGSFAVLVQHLLARLLSSASFDESGEASVSFFAQAAYAAALPTVLFALYLFPAYHQPLGKPDFWTQATHHFFYVDVSFAFMGLAGVLVWDLLFPDPSDVLVLGALPIRAGRLLAARVVAVALFLGGVLLGTSCLGIVFFPAVADLPVRFPWHFAVHALAVLAAGGCGACSVIVLQSTAICVLPRRVEQALSPLLQTVCVLLFTLVLVLEPLGPKLLQPAFAEGWWRWFPPFWFLGLYESLLYLKGASLALREAAGLGVAATSLLAGCAVLAYPFAFRKRMQQAVENAQSPRRPFAPAHQLARLLGSVLLGDGRTRAILYWCGQTLFRTRRTRLLLAFFAALILAGPVCTLLWSRSSGGAAPGLAQWMRLSIPAAAFLTVASLRTAFRAPVARGGAWAFRVIYGRPAAEHRRGAELWTAMLGGIACALTACLVLAVLPPSLRAGWNVGQQVGLGVLLSALLTRLLFVHERATPFTEVRTRTVNDLSFTVVTYFVLFPVASLALVAAEPWAEASRARIAGVLLCGGLGVWVFRRTGGREAEGDMEEEPLLPGEVGLRS